MVLWRIHVTQGDKATSEAEVSIYLLQNEAVVGPPKEADSNSPRLLSRMISHGRQWRLRSAKGRTRSLRSPAGSEPAHAGVLGEVRLAAKFLHPRSAGLNVIGHEVDTHRSLARFHVGIAPLVRLLNTVI